LLKNASIRIIISSSSLPAGKCTCNAHRWDPIGPASAIGGPYSRTPSVRRLATIAWPIPAHHRWGPLILSFLYDADQIYVDLHPDPFYKIHSSTEEDDACHRGKGSAGTYGAETTDCDTPFALVNATFKWIEENIKDTIDFVVWTGDSARHDNDEKIPRNQDEVVSTNRWVAERFLDVFGKDGDPQKDLTIPIISTFGNNDILPHNILLSGPNKWLKTYTDVWSKFIPEEQRHGFERGGWYYVEVIPNRLAVFSLNTLYFFSHNAAVDGCALRSEPGYEHMEWLRIQLQFMRQRGMKAILIGHIPPARTESKQLWDETCWQKYTLWLKQYRDVVVGGLYGHMNIDHFMLQDTKEVDLLANEGQPSANRLVRTMMEEELSIESASDYLEELRDNWSDLPNPNLAIQDVEESKKKKGSNKEKDKALKKIGGPLGERFHISLVGPSIVPNFFPTLRVIEYNITGLENTPIWGDSLSAPQADEQMNWLEDDAQFDDYEHDNGYDELVGDDDLSEMKKKKKNGKKHKKKPKKPKNPDLIIPDPPSKKSPPGPAYSPQTLTMLGYTQYFVNLTHINNDFVKPQELEGFEDDIDADKWHEGKHHGKPLKDKAPKPKPFQYQIEYDTFTDPIYNLKDMTVRSYIKLAHRIGQYKPQKNDQIDGSMYEFDEDEVAEDASDDDNEGYEDDVDTEKDKKKKHRKQKEKNKAWLQFIRRAFVGTLEDEDLQSFEQDPELDIPDLLVDEWRGEVHDGEL
jgi:endopolyphosphatase